MTRVLPFCVCAFSSTANYLAPPPKPQRSFPVLVSGSNNGQGGGNSGTILRSPATSQQQQQQQQPMSPNHIAIGVAPGNTASAFRPLPDRPYSVAGQFPGGPMLGGGGTSAFTGPDRRSFPADFAPVQAGYLSSPERRINIAPGEMAVRNPLYGTTWHHGPGGPVLGISEDVYGAYGHNIISSRPSSVAGGMVDDLARIKMENMERQLANLTGLVQAALNQPTVAGTTSSSSGQLILSIYFN